MDAIAVLGHGVVGSGVVEVLDAQRDALRRKTGRDIIVKRILDLRDFPGLPYADRFTKKADDILADPDIKVVVEVMGGLSPAYEYVRSALLAGKSVVTSNKELVAAKGAELLALAKDQGVNFLFEASVGGGIPVIRTLHQSLVAASPTEIVGILNGTTNFILTRMIADNMSFEDALELARQKGYAEADPSADIEGKDTCRKICILASMAFGKHVHPEKVKMEGITGIALEDVHYAEGAGYVVKLLGQTHMDDEGHCFVLVGPALVPMGSPLACVEDVFNAILIRSEVTGDIVLSGKGAGKKPTASAVVGDVVQCLFEAGTVPTLFWESAENGMADPANQPAGFYVRVEGPGAKEAAAKLCGKEGRILSRNGQPAEEAAFLTPPMPAHVLEDTLKELNNVRILGTIRVWG